MPVVSTLGAMSSRGFGEFNQQAQGKYIEDYFSTYLYTGNGATQSINNGIALSDTAAWSTFKSILTQTQVYGTTVDSAENVYTIGYDTTSGTTISIVKYNSSGVLQWQRNLKESASIGFGIAVDASDNVYVAGYANNGANYYAILAKYNSSGVLQWKRSLNQNNTFGRGVAVDTAGNPYIVGYANDGTSNYILVAKYDSNGTIQWQRKIQENGGVGYAIATDTSNNVFITGYANDGTNNYLVLVKFNSSGTLQWRRKLTENGNVGRGVAADSSGNCYVAGYATSTTQNYIILAKYDSTGAIQWKRQMTFSTNNAFGTAVTVDSSNNIYVSGYPTNGGYYSGFFAKYNSSGAIQWQRQLSLNGQDVYAWAICSKTSGNLYVAGSGDASANPYGYVSKLKTDGSTVSGTAILTMVPGSATDGVATATDANASSLVVSTASATDAAAGATDSAGSAVISTATQAAVTGAGGLVWMKGRSGATDHALYDTARGATFDLASNTTAAQTTQTQGLTSFYAGGFAIGNLASINTNTSTYASWTFRKQPKFFDVITYTGTGVAQTINHSLGSTPGFIIIKRTDAVAQWPVWHTSLPANNVIFLNQTTATQTISGYVTAVSSTTFSIGTQGNVNASGGSYVAYLFAHNAGGFGADGSQNAISCGSFTTDASGNATVSLGYEPQFVMFKASSTTGSWRMYDNMRGIFTGGTDAVLYANLTSAEDTSANAINLNATGFSVSGQTASTDHIYLVIRRGPMRTPTSGTSVFDPQKNQPTASGFQNTILTDAAFLKYNTGSQDWYIYDRLRGQYNLLSPSTAAEATSGPYLASFDRMTGFNVAAFGTGAYVSEAFRRAPGFFDVVCYTGTNVATTQTHNLGVAPELMIVKSRSQAATNWWVYSSSLGSGYYLILNTTDAATSIGSQLWNSTNPTSSVFSIGTSTTINNSGSTYVAYLFATCPGVSKVGSYTGTGATQTINCGFSGGARYVLIKRTDSTGDWWVWDTARGMVAGTDPRLAYNSAAAETNANWVYTTTGGFQIVTSDATVNASGGTYLFFAVS